MCPAAREVNMVKTKYGMVEGFRKDGCRVYLGIPFAKPPVGPLMFRHPAEPEPWEGVLKADRGGRNPVQVQGTFSRGNNSLDCLYLNVFVPEEDADTARPVMVWVYGGAYSMGGAGALKEGSAEIAYDFCRFARETRTVVVTFNYRLNLYGFLNLACLSRRFDRNNGLFDQIQALKFVRENIAAFGGDAGNVTVFGQSAGGACILALMSMPETEGLFHKAIVQSACIDHFFTEEESRARTKLYLKHMRIRHLSELFEVSAERVMAVNRSFARASMLRWGFICPFSPVVDDVTLFKFPRYAARERKIPLIIGNTAHECDLFMQLVPTPLLPPMALFFHQKPKKEKGSYRQRLSDSLSDSVFVNPQLEILKGWQGPAYRYVFEHVLSGSRLGDCHAAEVPFELGMEKSLDGTPIPETDRAGGEIREKWARFAWSGDPGWQPYGDGGEAYIFR